MSRTMSIYPIVAALVSVEQLEGVGPNRTWEPVTDDQAQFLPSLSLRPELEHISEIESRAAWQAEPLNTFLRERGFDIRLDPFTPQHFGAASVLDLLVKWEQAGVRRTVRSATTQRNYAAVGLTDGLQYFDPPSSHPHPIVQITTQSEGAFVYLTMLPDGSGLKGQDLLNLVADLASSKAASGACYSGVLFPMVNLKQEEDLSWLKGLKTWVQRDDWAKIDQALMQNVLKINEVGTRARSAVAVRTRLIRLVPPPPPPPLVIDRPFLVWFERRGLSVPLFAGHVTEDNWADPGDISTP